MQWETLGKRIYSTKIDQAIVSVSISPTRKHLLVGLESRTRLRAILKALIYKLTDKETITYEHCLAKTGLQYYNFHEISDPSVVNEFVSSIDNCTDTTQNDNEVDRYDQDWNCSSEDTDLYIKEKKKDMVLIRRLTRYESGIAAHLSLNCIRWAPQPGQGIVLATNDGKLSILH